MKSPIAFSFTAFLCSVLFQNSVLVHGQDKKVNFDSKLLALHQYHKKNGGDKEDHFYTTDFNELEGCKGKDGFEYEGIAAYVYTCPAMPFFRYYSPKRNDHFYTANPGEVLSKDDFAFEGHEGCLFPKRKGTGISGLVPLHRWVLKKKGGYRDTFYSDSKTIFGGKSYGYTYDGIAGYVTPAPKNRFLMCAPF